MKLEIAGVKNDTILPTTTLPTTTTGPWFYIQLSPGIYNLKASFAGQSKEAKAFRVSKGKNAQQVFVWDLGESHKAAPAAQG